MRATGMVMMMVMAGLTGTASQALAQKANAAPLLWRCDVTFRDAPGDAITSDGLGEYRDGTDGFICTVSPHDVAGTVPGSANFYFDRRPTRSVVFPAQTQVEGTWGRTSGHPQIRILDVANMANGATSYSAFRSPTGPLGKFFAEDLGDGDAVTDEVRVVRTGVCTWDVTFAAAPTTPQGSGRMQRYSGTGKYLGAPVMPFGFTVTTRAGTAAGECPQP